MLLNGIYVSLRVKLEEKRKKEEERKQKEEERKQKEEEKRKEEEEKVYLLHILMNIFI
jgi:hypothetical protein